MTSFDTVTSDVFNYAMGNLSYSDATATVPVTVTATVPVNVTPLIGLTTSATGAAGTCFRHRVCRRLLNRREHLIPSSSQSHCQHRAGRL